MKKAIVLVLAAIICLTFSITAFAADKLPKEAQNARDGVGRIYVNRQNGGAGKDGKNSGGHLVISDRHAVGINTLSYMNDAAPAYFAVSSDELIVFLTDNDSPYENGSKSFDMPTGLYIVLMLLPTVIVVLIAVTIAFLITSKHRKSAAARNYAKKLGAEPFDSPLDKAPQGDAVQNINDAAEPAATAVLPPRRKNNKAKIICLCSTVLVVLIAGGIGAFNLMQWNLIKTAVEKNDYVYAKELYNTTPYMRNFDENQFLYCWAQSDLERNDIYGAKGRFTQLGNYKDSKILLDRINKYLQASEMSCNTPQDYVKKITLLSELGNFYDSQAISAAVISEYYNWAVNSYNNLTLVNENALVIFSSFEDYGNAPQYAEFLSSYVTATTSTEKINMITKYVSLYGENEIIKPYYTNESFSFAFLSDSDWYSKNKEYYFYHNSDNSMYDASFPGSHTFNSIYIEKDGFYDDDKKVCELKFINLNTIELEVSGYERITMYRTTA